MSSLISQAAHQQKPAKIRVGIPKALLYYQYVPLWKQFFEALGAEVIISQPTNKAIVDLGVQQIVDEACFPLKVYFGHVISLANQVDYLFLPRLVSVETKTYICPKFLGLPDLVRNSVKGLPNLLSPDINLHQGNQKLYQIVWEVGSVFCNQPWKVYRAYREAYKAYLHYHQLLQAGLDPGTALQAVSTEQAPRLTSPGEAKLEQVNQLSSTGLQTAGNARTGLQIAVISHPYNLYDDYLNMGLLKKLREMGVQVRTPEQVPPEIIQEQTRKLPKQLFWSMGRNLVGAAYYYLECPEVDGMIHLAAFACGPDSFTGELIERALRRHGGKYFLNLTIDEHTGEAGLVTRLEAFIDLMQRRVAGCE